MRTRAPSQPSSCCGLVTAGCGGHIAALRAAHERPRRRRPTWRSSGSTRAQRRAICSGELAASSSRRRRLRRSRSVARDDSGFSVSYDVTSPDGTEWSAKIGPEAQTEVVMSRILWGLGYHQPPIYYLPSWTRLERRRTSGARERSAIPSEAVTARSRARILGVGRESVSRRARVPRPARGAADVEQHRSEGRQQRDLRRRRTSWDGASRWFLVRDLGAALGETGKLYPRRNWLEGFERSGFITSVSGDRVEFDYHGRHQELLAMITPDGRAAGRRSA